MSCQEFSGMVGELASLSLMDAGRREAAEAHVENCASCSRRLREERALVAALESLSRVDLERRAPDVVEDRLRAAFRAQHSVPAEEVSAKHGFSRFILLAAAILLAVIGISVFALRGKPAVETLVVQEQEQSKPAPVEVPSQASAQENGAQQVAKEQRPERVIRGRGLSQTGRERAIARRSRSGESVTVSLGTFVPVSNEAEIATDFIPMLPGVDGQTVESGRVIRVQMPRAALASFGLPFDVERADESVKADVLLGEDGLARAIRFVR